MKIVSNPNPTAAERELYHHEGFYKVDEDYDWITYRGTWDFLKREFPESIDAGESLRKDDEIRFDKTAEAILFERHCMIDLKTLKLLVQRAEELGWK